MSSEHILSALSKSALLIVNPVSGQKKFLPYVSQLVRELMDVGYRVTTMVTAKRGDATDFASAYGRGSDLIVCAGGDGTLNETLAGLVREGIHVPIGYIPCGSTNDFAASHGISADIPTAIHNIASGQRTVYDAGLFGEHPFTYVAAFGAFSWLSYTTDQNLKNRFGLAAYVFDGIRDLNKITPKHIRLVADGVVHEGDYIFGAVSNSPSVVSAIQLPQDVVDLRDGKLEVLLIRYPQNLVELDAIVRGLLLQDYSSPDIDFFQAEDIMVEDTRGVEWTLDGEGSGSFESVHIRPIHNFLELQG